VLVSSLSSGSAGGARLEHGLSVLVELQLGDDAVGWVDANVDGGAVDLLSLGSLDVDDELLSVDGLDSSGGLSLVVTSDNHDLVILSDWERSDVVLGSEFLGKRSGHDLASKMGRSVEVSASLLSSGSRDGCVKLHFCLSRLVIC